MGLTTWTVTRNGERVRVDLKKASGITPTDTVAISEALEEYLSDAEITVVQVGGPVLLESEMPPWLGPVMREIGDLARHRGKRFDVGLSERLRQPIGRFEDRTPGNRFGAEPAP